MNDMNAQMKASDGAKATKPNAVVAITKHGTSIARRLQDALPDIDIYYPQKFAQGDEMARGIVTFDGSVVQHVPTLFRSYKGIIGIFSLGAMVRLIAPHLRDKKTDPGVIVIDDRAEHVISVLSGHLGGANSLTHRVASALHARPVITTASDVGGTVAVDLLGRELGFEIENFEKVTEVSAAVVNEERVHIIQEAGERHWWPSSKPLPSYLSVFSSMEAASSTPFDAALVITPRLLSTAEEQRFLTRGVIYRPKVLVVGVGCNRGTSADEIEEAMLDTLKTANLSMRSVRNLATIDVKADEAGLLELCRRHDWPLITYTAAELNEVEIPRPSETVYKYVGVYGVSEPAAKLSAGARNWVVEKVKHGNVTVSVCMVYHEWPTSTVAGVTVESSGSDKSDNTVTER